MAGKNQGKHKSRQIKCKKVKVWIESEYYLNLASEDKKRYKEKLTPSNWELLPDPSVLDF